MTPWEAVQNLTVDQGLEIGAQIVKILVVAWCLRAIRRAIR